MFNSFAMNQGTSYKIKQSSSKRKPVNLYYINHQSLISNHNIFKKHSHTLTTDLNNTNNKIKPNKIKKSILSDMRDANIKNKSNIIILNKYFSKVQNSSSQLKTSNFSSNLSSLNTNPALFTTSNRINKIKYLLINNSRCTPSQKINKTENVSNQDKNHPKNNIITQNNYHKIMIYSDNSNSKNKQIKKNTRAVNKSTKIGKRTAPFNINKININIINNNNININTLKTERNARNTYNLVKSHKSKRNNKTLDILPVFKDLFTKKLIQNQKLKKSKTIIKKIFDKSSILSINNININLSQKIKSHKYSLSGKFKQKKITPINYFQDYKRQKLRRFVPKKYIIHRKMKTLKEKNFVLNNTLNKKYKNANKTILKGSDIFINAFFYDKNKANSKEEKIYHKNKKIEKIKENIIVSSKKHIKSLTPKSECTKKNKKFGFKIKILKNVINTKNMKKKKNKIEYDINDILQNKIEYKGEIIDKFDDIYSVIKILKFENCDKNKKENNIDIFNGNYKNKIYLKYRKDVFDKIWINNIKRNDNNIMII